MVEEMDRRRSLEECTPLAVPATLVTKALDPIRFLIAAGRSPVPMSPSIPHDPSLAFPWGDGPLPRPGSRGWCVAEACRLEATAEKPGNVHPRASFPDLDHAELVAAGRAIAPVIETAPSRPLGQTILAAVSASRRVTRSNANLGIILAIAPLASVPGTEAGRPFRANDVAAVLARLTREDAADTWEAIAMAAPGGMGRRGRWDLAGPPPDDLLAAMASAAPHDRIARLWAEGWGPLEDGLVADLLAEVAAGRPLEEGIVRGFLRQLGREPDTLIARRHGGEVAAEVSRRAAEVIERPEGAWREAAAAFDRSLRHPRRINPGTTADLCAAALYILLRDGRLCLADRALLGGGPAAGLDRLSQDARG
jgi:triphosphoribosyl-dephospho-CoA synthase